MINLPHNVAFPTKKTRLTIIFLLVIHHDDIASRDYLRPHHLVWLCDLISGQGVGQ